MSEHDEAAGAPQRNLTRRAIFTLAATVAALGAAVGVTMAAGTENVSLNFKKTKSESKTNKKSAGTAAKKNENKASSKGGGLTEIIITK
jgi:hypothetical protein